MKYLRFVVLSLLLACVGATAEDATYDKKKAPAPRIGASTQAVAVTMSMTPSTGTCPYASNIQWSASGASACTKSGAWSGSTTASGSASVQVNGTAVTYTLTCSASSDTRSLTWVNPTTNTDGTAANLGSNRVYHANVSTEIGSQNPAIVLQPAVQAYNLTGLPAGVRYVAISAVSAGGMESALSNVAQTTIVMPTGSQTVTASCTPPPIPKPPTAVTISSTVWDTKGNQSAGSIKVGSDVGFIDLGVKCLGDAPEVTQGKDEFGNDIEYWEADKNAVVIRPGTKPRPGILVARCQLKPTV